MDRKTFLCIYFSHFLFIFEKYCLQKMLEKQKGSFVEIKGFFCFYLNKRTAKKAASKPKRFLHTLFLENKEKTSENKYREMFSYQFVAHMPKIRQI